MTRPARSDPAPARSGNGHLSAKLLFVACAMFGFGFAMVPIYKKFCEVTGSNQLTRRDAGAEAFARNTQVDRSRKVVVEFDANGRGAWLFKPERNSIEVHPGELVTMTYDLTNTRERPTVGHAIPSYAPQVSARYFRKIECFCFEQQTLGGNETRRFPVVFVLDPDLPKDVNTVTLSYTFFEVGARDGQAAGTPDVVPAVTLANGARGG